MIDFTRNGIGIWLLFVCGAGLMVAWTRPGAELFRKGWKESARFLCVRILLGILMAAPLVGFLALWQRIPPQYFIKLRLTHDDLIIGFRWPKPDLPIPLEKVLRVEVVNTRNLGRSIHRVEVETSTDSFLSFGYGRLGDEDYKTLAKLREVVGAHRNPPALPEPEAR